MNETTEHLLVQPALNEADVASYLAQHVDFFERHPSLLSHLHLAHNVPGATSLIERQVSVLRDQNRTLRQQLDEMIRTAKDNEHLLLQSTALTLELLECATLHDAACVLQRFHTQEFETDAWCLLLVTEAFNAQEAPHIRYIPKDQLQSKLGSRCKHGEPVCTDLTINEREFLFNDKAEGLQSFALIPLGDVASLGVLALASRDPDHFAASKGTFFLNYIHQVISRLLHRLR